MSRYFEAKKLLEFISQPVVVFSCPEGIIIGGNNRFFSLLGCTPDEIIGNEFLSFFSSTEGDEGFLKRLGGEGRDIAPMELRTIDGKQVRIKMRAISVSSDGEGRVLYAGLISPISQRERQLKEGLFLSEERYKKILDSASDIIFILNREGRFIYVNAQGKKRGGYSLEELIGKKFDPLVVPEDLSKAWSKFQHTLKGNVHSYELRVRRKDGSIIYLEIDANPIMEDGEVVGSLAIARDITERKMFEQRLEAQSRIINTMFDAVVGIDLEEKINFWNRGAERIFGYRVEEVLGKPLTILVPDDTKYHLEIETVLAETRSVGYYPYLETKRRRKDGKLIDVALTLTSIYNEGKNLVGTAAVLRDISEEKRVRQRLRWMERIYREIFENANDIIISLDSRGRFSLVNPRFTEITGLPLVKARKRHFSEVVYKDDLRKVRFFFHRALRKGTGGKLEFRFVDRDGEVGYAEGNFNPMRIGGKVVGIQGIVRDISGRVRMEEGLKEGYRKLIKVLAAFIEIKDLYTEEHSRRIIDDSVYLAERLGLSEEEIKDIEIAAILHDIGKMKVPGYILNKEGVLNEEERALMIEHSRLGAEAVQGIEEFKNASRIILYHHERYDGNGYPEGLKGEDIPLGARIIAVVDAFDAMCSDRPYRKAMSREEAIAELIREKGKQFDPAIVDLYIKYLKKEKK